MASLVWQSDTLTVAFSNAYIHSSEGRAGRDAGIGWFQPAELVLSGASIEGEWPELPADAYEGSFQIDGLRLNNEIPLPLDAAGQIEIRLTFYTTADYHVRMTATHARVVLSGEPGLMETFPGSG